MDVIVSIAVLILISWIIYSLVLKRNNKYVPGPFSFPVIGNSLDVDSNNLHVKFDEWARYYGDMFQVNVFGRNIIVLNSADVIREALMHEPNATLLSDRSLGFVGKEFFYNYHDIGFARLTNETTKRRKLGHRLMKTYGEGMAVIENCILQELDITVAKLKKLEEKVVDPEKIVDDFLCGVIITLFAGRRYDTDSVLVKTMREFDQQLGLMMNPGVDFLLKWFPVLKNIPCQISRDYHKAKDKQNSFFALLKSEMDNNKASKGIVYALHQAKIVDLDDNGHQWIKDDDIYGILTNLLSAAFLTSKATILSLIHCLISNPSVQARIQQEVDQVVPGDRLPILSDKGQMPYTEAVILEVLRLATNSPLPIPHCAMDNTTLRGFLIPKGTTLMLNLWTVHHREDVWKDPYDFKPERFLDDNGNLQPKDSVPMQNMIAFGMGKRSCIGEVFAKNRVFLFLSAMMKNFTFEPVNKETFLKFDPRNMRHGLVRIPHSFTCKAADRKR